MSWHLILLQMGQHSHGVLMVIRQHAGHVPETKHPSADPLLSKLGSTAVSKSSGVCVLVGDGGTPLMAQTQSRAWAEPPDGPDTLSCPSPPGEI